MTKTELNECRLFVRKISIALHVLPHAGQPRKGWIGSNFGNSLLNHFNNLDNSRE
jgi:hypothetical protein